MAVEVSSVRSRRALLVGAFGGMAALAAQALGRPSQVLGADVVLGGTNTTTAKTTIQNTSTDSTVLELKSSQTLALVARGTVGALITGREGAGLTAVQASGPSLIRASALNAGVVAFGESMGVRGSSTDKVGVLGVAGGEGPENMPPNAGVYGWSTAEGIGVSMGLLGRSTAPTGYGAFGTSDSGTGVQGFTKSGTAMSATVGPNGTGRAFAANGRVSFSSSGIATVAAGNSQKVVDPGIALTPKSKVLATVMGNPGGSIVLKRVIVDAAADTFTIALTGSAANATDVAWFVLD
jgi:hypothetical protein